MCKGPTPAKRHIMTTVYSNNIYSYVLYPRRPSTMGHRDGQDSDRGGCCSLGLKARVRKVNNLTPPRKNITQYKSG